MAVWRRKQARGSVGPCGEGRLLLCASDEPSLVLSVPFEAPPTVRRAVPMENLSTYYLRPHARAATGPHTRMAFLPSCRLMRALLPLQMAPAARSMR